MSPECEISTWKWPEIQTDGRTFSLPTTPLSSSFQQVTKVCLPQSFILQEKKVYSLIGKPGHHSGNQGPRLGNRVPPLERQPMTLLYS